MNGGVQALAATFMATSVLVLAGTGCQSTAGLTPAEREQVQAGDRVVRRAWIRRRGDLCVRLGQL